LTGSLKRSTSASMTTLDMVVLAYR
jgi:hypothetical protein